MKNIKLDREPPAQYKTLDDLFAQAAHYAEFCLRNSGQMQPAVFILSEDGPARFFAFQQQFGDETSKQKLLKTARLFCVAHAATMSVFAIEAWTMYRSPEEHQADPKAMPSEAMDRIEAVMLIGEERGNKHTGQMLRIIRHDNGKFFNLAEPRPVESGSAMATGELAHLLAGMTAPPHIRKLAKEVLEAEGLREAGIAPKGKKV